MSNLRVVTVHMEETVYYSFDVEIPADTELTEETVAAEAEAHFCANGPQDGWFIGSDERRVTSFTTADQRS